MLFIIILKHSILHVVLIHWNTFKIKLTEYTTYTMKTSASSHQMVKVHFLLDYSIIGDNGHSKDFKI